MATRIQFRRDTAAVWQSVDPILSIGEFGYETDTGKFKLGNGADTWNNLDYHYFDTHVSDLSDVVISNVADGQILQYNGTGWVNTVQAGNEPMGFENRLDSVIGFDNSTRLFSIGPVSTTFTVWCAGKRFVKSSVETIEVPNVTGLYFIYYDSSGDLATQTDYFDWENEAPTAYVYWNATTAKAEFFADERHGIVLDWQTHEYLHRTRGAAIANGFGLGSYTLTGDGSSNAHLQVDVTNGTFFDEDLEVEITHSLTPTANTWEQVLQGGAEIPIFYRSGSAWVKTTATKFPVKQGTLPQYNSESGGVWSATDLTTGTYGVTYLVATNNVNEPILGILGQKNYQNLNKVSEESWGDLNLSGLPIYELRPLYKLVYLVSSTFTNTPKAVLRQVIDLRSVDSIVQIAAGMAQDHGLLLGLSDDDHDQYVHLSNPRTVTAVHTFSNGLNAGSLTLTGGSTTSLFDVIEHVSTSTASGQTIDSTQALAIKYQIYCSDASNSEVVELLAVRQGATVNFTEYGRITIGSEVAVFDVTQSSGNILLQVTPATSNSTYRVIKTTINS
jgi:hypothetical protein